MDLEQMLLYCHPLRRKTVSESGDDRVKNYMFKFRTKELDLIFIQQKIGQKLA